MILPDGIQAAADREKQFHPKVLPAGTPISAWQRRADTLIEAIGEVNRLRGDLGEVERELAALKGALVQRPF
jgi:hypothetical protein